MIYLFWFSYLLFVYLNFSYIRKEFKIGGRYEGEKIDLIHIYLTLMPFLNMLNYIMLLMHDGISNRIEEKSKYTFDEIKDIIKLYNRYYPEIENRLFEENPDNINLYDNAENETINKILKL